MDIFRVKMFPKIKSDDPDDFLASDKTEISENESNTFKGQILDYLKNNRFDYSNANFCQSITSTEADSDQESVYHTQKVKSKNGIKKQYNKKSSIKSKTKKNVIGLIRERIVKSLKLIFNGDNKNWEANYEKLSDENKEKLKYLSNFCKNLSIKLQEQLMGFLRHYHENYNVIKPKKDLKALHDLCKSVPGGDVFANIVIIFVKSENRDKADWIENFKGLPETKQVLSNPDFSFDVESYLQGFICNS